MSALLLNFHANTEHKERLFAEIVGSYSAPFFFLILYFVCDGGVGGRQNDKLKILTVLQSLRLQLSQWYSSYATFQLCPKIKVRFGGMFGIPCERHIYMYIIFNKVHVYFMTQFIPGRKQGHLVNIQLPLSCVGWIFFLIIVSPLPCEMFGCKTVDFCLFSS